MTNRLRHILRSLAVDDLLPGDFVRRPKIRGIGFVESVADDHVVVSWNKDQRDILPFAALRRVCESPNRFDSRRGR